MDPDGSPGYIRTVALRANQSGQRFLVDPGGSTGYISAVSLRADQSGRQSPVDPFGSLWILMDSGGSRWILVDSDGSVSTVSLRAGNQDADPWWILLVDPDGF